MLTSLRNVLNEGGALAFIREIVRPFGGSGAAFGRWSLASVFSFSMVVGLTAFLHEVCHVGEQIAFLVPLVILFTANFFICRFFVYRSHAGSLGRQFAGYAVSVAGFRIAEYLVYWFLIDVMNVWYLLAVFFVVPTSFVVKFLAFGGLVFREGDLQRRRAR